MDNEVRTLIALKYGDLAIHKEYIKGLPAPVSERLGSAWPFITVEDVRAALTEYELGKKVTSYMDRLNPLL